MPTAGDIKEITYNHPTIGSGVFFPKAAEDGTYDLGGLRGNDDANMVDGGGRNLRQLNQARWSIDTPVSWDMNNSEELEKLNALAGDPVEADWTITHINGTIYGGTGSPVGDVQGNSNTGIIQLKVSGGNKMKKLN